MVTLIDLVISTINNLLTGMMNMYLFTNFSLFDAVFITVIIIALLDVFRRLAR